MLRLVLRPIVSLLAWLTARVLGFSVCFVWVSLWCDLYVTAGVRIMSSSSPWPESHPVLKHANSVITFCFHFLSLQVDSSWEKKNLSKSIVLAKQVLDLYSVHFSVHPTTFNQRLDYILLSYLFTSILSVDIYKTVNQCEIMYLYIDDSLCLLESQLLADCMYRVFDETKDTIILRLYRLNVWCDSSVEDPKVSMTWLDLGVFEQPL